MSRILVAGASGQVGTRLVPILRHGGHSVVDVSRSNGIDVVTGSGLRGAMAGVTIVIDVTNAAAREPDQIARFFEASSLNLVESGAREGVAHHVVLSVAGADRMPGSAYMRGKVIQENVVAAGGVPFTIVRATQFFDFVARFPEIFGAGGEVRLPAGRMQPIDLDDVARTLARVASMPPARGHLDLGGPRPMTIRDAVARILAGRGDPRAVTASRTVAYFGAVLDDDTLLPAPGSLRGTIDLEDWIRRPPASA